MKLTGIIYEMLIKEYKENFINKLITKFKSEDSDLSDLIIRNYINRFSEIQDSPKVIQKDITQYSWKELESVVDSNQKTRIKAGKFDPTAEDADMLYNKDGVRMYVGKTKQACIKYGSGYSFCISARSSGNMYGFYRIKKSGTPYFIFNDNLPKENPNHVLVIFFYPEEQDDNLIVRNVDGEVIRRIERGKGHFTITDANNEGDFTYSDFSKIVSKYPWTQPLQDMIKDVPVDEYERKEKEIRDEYESNIEYLHQKYKHSMSQRHYNLRLNSYYNDYVPLLNGEKNVYTLVLNSNVKLPDEPKGYNTWSEKKKEDYKMIVGITRSILKSPQREEYIQIIKDVNDDYFEWSEKEKKKFAYNITRDGIDRFIGYYIQLDTGHTPNVTPTSNLFTTIQNFIQKQLMLKDIKDDILDANWKSRVHLKEKEDLEKEMKSKLSKLKLSK